MLGSVVVSFSSIFFIFFSAKEVAVIGRDGIVGVGVGEEGAEAEQRLAAERMFS